MKLTVHEVFEMVSKAENIIDATEILKRYADPDVMFVLSYMFNENFIPLTKLDIPEYTKNEAAFGYNHSYIWHNRTRFELLKINNKVPVEKKQKVLMGILGGLHARDAEMVEKMVQHKPIKYKRVTETLVRRTFPDFLPQRKK